MVSLTKEKGDPVPLEKTQPLAKELIDYERMEEKLRELEKNPRVRVLVAGKSHAGKNIYLIVIGEPQTILSLDYQRDLAKQIYTPTVLHKSLENVEVIELELKEVLEKAKVPVMIHCESFGFEAAHTEAILKVAEILSTSDEAEIKQILDKLIVLLMPMMNPDGRMSSIEQWNKYPRCPGWDGAGNLYGFLLNRDFHRLSQPETQAVHRVFNEWRPVASIDTHEDIVILGVSKPEVCWAPPFAKPYYPELDNRVISLIDRLGGAIAEEWKRMGYNVLYHPKGEHGFLGLFMLDGRYDLHFDIHGIPVVITESARTLGTQTWKARIDQKVLACLAFLKEVAGDVGTFVKDVYQVRKDNVTQCLKDELSAFIIPIQDQKDPVSLYELIDVLLIHGILVYKTEKPYPAYVVPLSQPERLIVRALLLAEKWNMWAFPYAMGVTVLRFDTLPEEQKEAFKKASLTKLSKAEYPAGGIINDEKPPVSEVSYAIPCTNLGITLVNKLLSLGQEIYWVAEPFETAGQTFEAGTLIVNVKMPGLMKEVLKATRLQVYRLPSNVAFKGYEIRFPRVALYTGQGVDERNIVFKADTLWALEKLGFTYVPVTEKEIKKGVLKYFDVLVVPGGDAREILNGWSKEIQWNKDPWQLPGEIEGLRSEGIAAIKKFIEEGGGYVGISAGGGSLACEEVTGLTNVKIKAHTLGQARVYLKIQKAEHPVMMGFTGFKDEEGKWHEEIIPAVYYSEPLFLEFGGPVFEAGGKAEVLATYHAVDYEPWTKYLANPEPLQEDNPAIIAYDLGKGKIILFGINPDFRAFWTGTFRLLSNAIYFQVAEGPIVRRTT